MLGLAEPPLRGRAQYDLRKGSPFMKRVNAVVVGAGAAGGIVAKELSTAGLSVVLLERGKWYTANDCRKDDLRNQRTTVLGNAFGPEDEGNPRVWVDAEGRRAHGAAQRRRLPEQRRLRGRRNAQLRRPGLALSAPGLPHALHLWRARRAARSKTGPSPTTIWSRSTRRPNTRSASPATTRAPRFMVRAAVLCPCRRCRPIASSRSSSRPPSASACIRSTFPWPATACPTTAADPACAAAGAVGFACEVDAKNGSQNTVIPVALTTGNCELRTECMAKEILTDDRGRARGVSYFDANGHLQEQLSDIVIVSGCAIESARLLLNSRSRLFPNGLGNRYDQVGRNLARPPLHRRRRLLRLRNLRRRRPRRQHRHHRLQPRHTGPLWRRHARQRVHPPAHPHG